MRRLFSAAAVVLGLVLALLVAPSASAQVVSVSVPAITAVKVPPRPSVAGLSTLPRVTAATAEARYIDCYTTSVRGINNGQTGTWYYQICYDTVTCEWVITRAFFVPDPCKPKEPC
jgi:hypothetical protein